MQQPMHCELNAHAQPRPSRTPTIRRLTALPFLAVCLWLAACASQTPVASPTAPADPLPSWSETTTKAAILTFVRSVSDPTHAEFVDDAERIAVFDNDGTLIVEHPLYSELTFAIDRVQELAPQHPEWQTTQPYAAAIKDDTEALFASGGEGITKLISASHSGMNSQRFHAIATQWLKTATHPRFKRHYPELVYQPMVELLTFLRANGFKTYIVSAGGADIMRCYSEGAYGIPAEQVIGTTLVTEFTIENGVPTLQRKPEIFFFDNGPAKPSAIQRIIGRRPIAAFGNSDGDLQMLQWTSAGTGLRFGALVHHTDAEREYAYDRDTPVGELDQALTLAPNNDWTVIDMRQDWKRVFPAGGMGSRQ